LEKVFGKIASPTTSCIVERQRNGRSCNKLLFFQLHPTYVFVRGGKNSFTHEAVLEIRVWQKKKLITAHEAIVSCNRRLIYERAHHISRVLKAMGLDLTCSTTSFMLFFRKSKLRCSRRIPRN